VQVAEACFKRCGPAFHEQLAISQFFHRIQQAIVQPDSAQVWRASHVYWLQHS
jgi:hypothetical protein